MAKVVGSVPVSPEASCTEGHYYFSPSLG